MSSWTPAPAPTRRGSTRVVVIAVAVVAALLAVLIGGELYARNRVENCLTGQLQSQLGSNVDVSLGATPVLLSLITKKVSSVSIDSADSTFGPARDMTVRAEISDVDLNTTSAGSGSIGSSRADVTWSAAGIESTLASQGLGGLISGVTTDRAAGTINFAVVGGLAQLTVAPKVVGGKIEVTTVDARILGLGIPTSLADSVVAVLADSLQGYPLGLTATSVTVTDSGVEFTLTGGQFTLPAAQPGQSATASC